MKTTITKRVVDALATPERGAVKVYDDTLTGFGVMALPSGKRSFFIEYGPRAKRRRYALGLYGRLTVAQARELAQAKLADLIRGVDPMRVRREARAMPSVREWVATYLERVRQRKKQPRHDVGYLDTGPGSMAKRWGSKPLDTVTRRDVQDGLAAMAKRGRAASVRWLASVRACFEEARRDGLLKENPGAGLKKPLEGEPRGRYLSDEEHARVVDAIAALDEPHIRAAFVLLLDTGARKSEVLRARWADLDLDAGLWRIPSPKAGRPQVVPLPSETVAMLAELPRMGEWLIPGRKQGKPREDVKRAWDTIRAAAAIPDVRMHDLRRTFGVHVARTAGLHMASKLLRHTDVRVTERVYVPLGIEAQHEAMRATHAARKAKVLAFTKAKPG